MIRRALLFGILLLLAANVFAGTGKIVIMNRDAQGFGFNDPTPVAPVGGNDGTTIGQQRLKVFERAAYRWMGVLDTNVDIRIRASFATLSCSDTRVVLGQATAATWHANFPNAPRANVWYPHALANKFAGFDLSVAEDDILMQFNSALDNATCLGDRGWYYGFDGNEGLDNSLYHVVLHEIGHGLGFTGYSYPDFYLNRPSVFDLHMLDVIAGRTWDQLTVEERRVSMTNTGNLAWSGPNVTQRAASILHPLAVLTVTAPTAKNYDIGTAGFGPPASRTPMSGPIVPAIDAANTDGPSATDGCTTYDNAADVSGKIALVDRGTCTFVQKALTAQAAGAVGLIIADNRKDTCIPPPLGGDNDDVRIPAVSLTQDEGAALRAQLATETVTAMLRVDPSRRAGATPQGYVRLYAPCTLEPSSSLYHFDTTATPNLIMEPAINGDLLDTTDLATYLMLDIGWSLPPRTGRRFRR